MSLAASVISSDRLTLTPLVEDDADAMVAVYVDERMHEFTGGRPFSLDELRSRYRRLAVGHSPDRSELWFNWIVRTTVDGRTVGATQATVAADGSSADVAWEIGVPWQGRGIASEAATAVVSWLIDHDVRLVRALIHSDHHASARVAANAGLTPTPELVDDEVVWRRDGRRLTADGSWARSTVRGMGTKQYVALLRGINVGGRNKVAMADLRAMFEEGGYGAVRTYIQSGNALFVSDTPAKSLEGDIEGMLERRFGVPLVVVVRSHARLRNVVDKAPDGFGKSPDIYHSDAIFLRAPVTANQAMRIVELRDGVDQAWPGDGVLYFSRLSAERTKSRLNRLVMTPEYQRMTIRSWSTTTKLLGLLDKHGGQ